MKSSSKKPPDKPKSAIAIRKEKQQLLDYSNIKCSWNSFCKNPALKVNIQKIILNINQIDFLSTRLINFHMIRCIQENIELPELNQQLYYKACCIVSKMTKRNSKTDNKNELYISFSKFNEQLTDLPFRDNMGALIANLNRTQLTNAKNHLKLNFYKRLRSYISLKTGEYRNSVLYKWLRDIVSEQYNGQNYFIHFIREKLLNNIIPTETNILKNTSHFIKVYYKLLSEFEKYSNQKGIRTFTLLPVKSGFTMSHITICNTSLRDIISYTTDKPLIKNFMDEKDTYWRELFHIDKYETSTRKFSYIIETNGYAVSILLQKERTIKKQKNEKKIKKKQDIKLDNDYEHFVGIDPGIRMLFTSYDNNDNVNSISTRQYRHDSKMNYARRKRENWYKNWTHYDLWKNIPSMKVTKQERLLKYFQYILPNMKLFFDFHIKKNFRSLNFTSYCRSKRKLSELCSNIIGNSKTLIGFGDFSQSQGLIKKHPTTPILRLKNELKRRCHLIDVDEYNTSKTCSSCQNKVELYRNRICRKGSEKARMSNIHSVIRCKLNECSLYYMDRDINASRNILELLKCQYNRRERPKCFARSKDHCDTSKD